MRISDDKQMNNRNYREKNLVFGWVHMIQQNLLKYRLAQNAVDLKQFFRINVDVQIYTCQSIFKTVLLRYELFI
jgi:hypothetical protein